jgi:hypothetical protein
MLKSEHKLQQKSTLYRKEPETQLRKETKSFYTTKSAPLDLLASSHLG